MVLGEGIPVPFHLYIKEIGKFWIVLVIVVLCCVIECIVSLSLTKGLFGKGSRIRTTAQKSQQEALEVP